MVYKDTVCVVGLLVWISSCCGVNPTDTTLEKSDDHSGIIIRNDPKFKINVTHTEHSDATQCTSYFGTTLRDCMECLSDKDFKNNLYELSSNARLHYLNHIPNNKLRGIRAKFSKQEWEELRAHDAVFVIRFEQWLQSQQPPHDSTLFSSFGAAILRLIAMLIGG